MSTLTLARPRPLRLLLAGTGSAHWADAWTLISQTHPHWFVDLTTSVDSARRYLDDHAVDAVIAGLSEVDAAMATVLATARAAHPTVRRIAVVDGATRSHPEARRASAIVESASPAATLLSDLDTALA